MTTPSATTSNNVITTQRPLTLGYVGFGTGRVAPFDRVFPEGKLVSAKQIEEGAEIDALIIWGGEDISPSLYGEKVSHMTGADVDLSRRDRIEASACLAAMERGLPLIGVCRGAQLLCAIAGGRLIQHVSGHGSSHQISTFDGKGMKTTSVHHQMMFPFNVEHKMIAWSTERQSKTYINGDDQDDPAMKDKPEPEIVWFPRIKGLAIQGHPEFVANPDSDPFVQYCLDKVREFIISDYQQNNDDDAS